MKRTNAYGATIDNKFTSGDPIGGVPATRVSADWLNVMQEEVAGVIENAGLTLDQGNDYPTNDTTQLYQAIQAIVSSMASGFRAPVGSIIPYAGDPDFTPDGWLICDGSVVLREEYPALFEAIGTRWGTSSSSDFRVPDLRGYFLRGWDGGAGIDSNSGSRVAKYAGGATGDNVGSYQADGVGPHTHGFAISLGDNNDDNANPPAASNGSLQGVTYNGTTGVNSGAETRPKNASVLYIIRHGGFVPAGP